MLAALPLSTIPLDSYPLSWGQLLPVGFRFPVPPPCWLHSPCPSLSSLTATPYHGASCFLLVSRFLFLNCLHAIFSCTPLVHHPSLSSLWTATPYHGASCFLLVSRFCSSTAPMLFLAALPLSSSLSSLWTTASSVIRVKLQLLVSGFLFPLHAGCTPLVHHCHP